MKKYAPWSAIVLWFSMAVALPFNAAAESPDDILVFVSIVSKVNSLTVPELRQIFLKQKTTWQNGNAIICVNAPSASEVRKQFRQKVLAMTESEESTHWETMKIRSQIFAPAEMPNTAKAVFKLKNAVSYAFRKDVPNGVVKVVLVIPK
jgi:ABC-type phosphate transport system substrate-binding protein